MSDHRIRAITSPVTRDMLRPLEGESVVQFPHPLTDREYKKVAGVLRGHPEVALRAYGLKFTDLEFLRYLPPTARSARLGGPTEARVRVSSPRRAKPDVGGEARRWGGTSKGWRGRAILRPGQMTPNGSEESARTHDAERRRERAPDDPCLRTVIPADLSNPRGEVGAGRR